MGMSVSSGGGGGGRGGRRRRGRSAGVMSEINVTPFVDVVLVLLIVFMVAAPMLTVGVPIDLPQTQAREMSQETQPITIGVTSEGLVYIGEDQIPMDGLVAAVNGLAVNGTEERIYVRGDSSAAYGAIMQVMGTLSGAGYSRIGLVTDQARNSGTAAPAAGQ